MFSTHWTITAETEHQLNSRLLLDVVVRQGASIFQLPAIEDQPSLVFGKAFHVLVLDLNIRDGVRGLYLESDCLASDYHPKDYRTSKSNMHI